MKDTPDTQPAQDPNASQEGTEGKESPTQPGARTQPPRPNGSSASEAEAGGQATAPGGAQATAPGDAQAAAQEGGQPAGEPGEDLAAALAALREEATAFQDRYLRAEAELENFKRRMAKENEERLKYALTPLVKEVAGVMDNLERALEHARANPGEDGQALLDGIEMVVKQMLEAFSRCGVTRIEAAGQPFDPNLHEAMTVVETAEVPEGQVVAEFQAGYMLHDRVVRPTRVSVAKPPSGD